MSFPSIPAELWWSVLDHLRGDSKSLQACALTCRSLVAPSQANLFHTLQLDFTNADQHDKLEKFTSNPHLVSLVKHISVYDWYRPPISTYSGLQQLLLLLSPHVVSLRISHRSAGPDIPWFQFPSLAQLLYLEEISIREIDAMAISKLDGDTALPVFLNYFPRLRVLLFEGFRVSNKAGEGRKEKGLAPPIFKLEHLYIWDRCDNDVLMAWIMPALSTLRRLRVPWIYSDAPITMSTLISHAGESLEHVDLDYMEDASEIEISTVMTALREHCPNLKSLSLMRGTPPGRNPEPPIEGVTTALSEQLCMHPGLQYLTIKTFIYSIRTEGYMWKELDTALDGTNYPKLRRVELLIPSSPPTLTSASAKVKFCRMALAKLLERKILFVHVGEWDSRPGYVHCCVAGIE